MELILTKEEIDMENDRMFLESSSLISLISYPTVLTNKQLKETILSDYVPSGEIDIDILKNRNLKNINQETEIKKGILINKSTLRYLPTNNSFYSSIIVDNNIATELSFATPILIIHSSLDKKWVYIRSYYYKGWILADDIEYLDDSSFQNFLFPNEFIVITDALLSIDNITIDMGVKLPLLAIHDSFYEVLIPLKNNSRIIKISSSSASINYLPYTKENIFKQSYKYLDTPYTWGGTNNGIDCSLLIVNIFKTFGLLFPRDTCNQENIVGVSIINLKGKTEKEKMDILANIPTPFILYKKGHVLLGLDKNKVLHAYGDAQKVFISSINDSVGTNLYPLLTSVSCLYKNSYC